MPPALAQKIKVRGRLVNGGESEPPFHYHNVAGITFARQSFTRHPTLKDDLGNAARVPVEGVLQIVKASKVDSVKRELSRRYLSPVGRGRWNVVILGKDDEPSEDMVPVSRFLRLEPVDDPSVNLLESASALAPVK